MSMASSAVFWLFLIINFLSPFDKSHAQSSTQTLDINVSLDRTEIDFIFQEMGFSSVESPIYVYENSIYTIAQLRGAFCKTDKLCLTLIKSNCRKVLCPKVLIFAGNSFLKNDTFFDYYGFRSTIVFNDKIGVIINNDSIIISQTNISATGHE